MIETSNKKQSAWFLLIVLSFIWGSSFMLMKKGLLSFSPVQIACIRVIVSALVLIVPALQHMRKLKRKEMPFILISGFVGSFAPSILFAIAIKNIPSAIAGVLNSLTPLFVAIISVVWFNFKLKKTAILGFTLSFIGSVLLSFDGRESDHDTTLVYILLVLLACLCYAVNLNLVKYKLKKVPSLAISSLSLVSILIPAIIILFITSDNSVFTMNNKKVTSLIYIVILGLSSTALALLLFNRLLKIASPTFSGSIAYLVPIVAIAIGLLDGETMSSQQMIGILIIFSGVLLINSRKR